MTTQPKRCAVCGKFTAKQELYCKSHVYEAMVANRDEWRQIAFDKAGELIGRTSKINELKSQLEAATILIDQLESTNRQQRDLVAGLRADIAGLMELSSRRGLWARFTRLLRLQI